MANVWQDGERLGENTTGAWGDRVDASLAIGMVRADLTEPGTELEVEIFGQMHPATVQDMPFWDPDNERIRA